MKLRHCYLKFAICILTLSTTLNAQTLVSAKPPAYPLTARAAGIDGPVRLKGTISKEGKMQNLNVLSGPPELRRAAIDAVMSWTYKPYMSSGRPVEVDTTVTVNFNMGKGKDKAAAQAKAKVELATASRTKLPSSSAPNN